MRGFSLVELMIALVVLTVGLLSVARVLLVTASSASLARSKGVAAIAAQDELEFLAAIYQQNPSAADLAFGKHGPRQSQVVNPVDGSALNRYSIVWDVSAVPDPRPAKIPDARLIAVTVIPARSGGDSNSKPGMNKIFNVSTIFSRGKQ